MISSSRYNSLWNVQRRLLTFNKLIQPLLFSTHTGGKGFPNFLFFSCSGVCGNTFCISYDKIPVVTGEHSALSPFLTGNTMFQGKVLFFMKLHTTCCHIVQEARESTRLLDMIWLSASTSFTSLTFFKSLLTISEHLKYLPIVVLLNHEIPKLWIESCKAGRAHLQLTDSRL